MKNLFILYATCLLGGAYLICSAFTKKGNKAPHWVRAGLIYAGIITFLLGSLGSTVWFYGRLIPKQIYSNIAITYHMLIGASLSILGFLFISRAFKELSQKRKTDEVPPTP